ncbi:MAG: DNA-directed RNA polymerase subunit N [Candidatus Methanolliviera hydrocarbonicum]|jgi:DNA-directed RNA polymerase, subunit N (EC 2.7.7.6)|uniref:DNA-directed RNA polymerase subunit Rpo10 n=1 Tax=Candidatus Methanolliviera hydrocarbonicum TaxID=2491085 RepID=A0A520KYP9_9EURY|nr:MAG: DNA-directed RNA polymerase subunit N [Candidatus Methanolliviera hydrocarbonicum]
MFPIRCFTCGKVISRYWEEYKQRVKDGEEPGKILNDLGIERYCCRRIFLTHVETIDILSRYG